MEIAIQIDEPFRANINPESIEQAVTITLHLQPTRGPNNAATMSVVVTGNETVQQLNHQYRGIDAPTDVLSFANSPDPDFPLSESTSHLGDVIIAYPIAETQARAAGHTIVDEIILLTVHGMLHLLGFDHDIPVNKGEMWTAQRQILAQLGLTHVQPTES